MRRLLLLVLTISVSCGMAHAQSTIGAPGMPATSPLGIPGSTSAASAAGIPLGATEINPGGLSPMPVTGSGANCVGMIGSSTGTAPAQMAGSATAGASSSFDGGGLTGIAAGNLPYGTAIISSSCASTTGTTSSTGIASPLANPAANAGSTLNGGTIPLGATEIGSAGVSPMINVPGPDSSATVCAGSSVGGNSAVATGTSGLTDLAAGSTSTLVPNGASGVGSFASPSGC